MTVEGIKGSYTNANDVYTSKKSSYTEEYRKLLEEKLAKQDEVIENGSTEEPIQVGGRAYTSEEWDEMLENFDATLEDLREQMRVEHERRYEEQLQKAADIRSYGIALG